MTANWSRRVLILLVPAAATCAQPESPPGGPEDLVPPVVLETTPDTFAFVEPGVREFHVRFNERISERPRAGQLDDAVVISPSIGDVRVRHGRDAIRIESQDGLQPGIVYRVTVLPVINDMFSNSLRDPFDLVLSTGPEFVPNVVAGMVEDRITGQAVPDVRVMARFGEGDDTLTHWNYTGTDGVFSLRYVPAAPFEVLAWQDRDRNAEIGDEPQSSSTGGEFARSPDTVFTILTLIEPDTTPPFLSSVTVQDSVTLHFEFDDYLEPDLPGILFEGQLVLDPSADSSVVVVMGDSVETLAAGEEPDDTVGAAEPAAPVDPEVVGDSAIAVATSDSLEAQPGDSTLATPDDVPVLDTVTVPRGRDTIAIRFYHNHEHEIRLQEVEDSLAAAAAQALADSLAELGEAPPEAEEPETASDTAEAQPENVGLSGKLLPAQTLIGVLEEALIQGAPYEATVSGVMNIAGEPNGGGNEVVIWALPPPDTATADTTVAGPDSLTGDTTGAALDSVATDTTGAALDSVATDTTGVVPDSIATDTTGVVPDSVATDTTGAVPDSMAADTTRTRSEDGREPLRHGGPAARASRRFATN